MSRRIHTIAFTVAILSGALASFAVAGELQPRAVPKPVMDAVKTRFKGAKFMAAAKETTTTGAPIYEVSLTDKGKAIDLMVTPAGAITLIEKEIAQKDLPKGPADTLAARYPKAKFQLYEEVYTVEAGKETLMYYEVILIDPHKQTWAVEMELNGVVRKIENKTGEVD